jgi:oxalate decarboxylase/phosphoglucose isomerase-like protein (cupin superfamily)
MSVDAQTVRDATADGYIRDPYVEWSAAEGIPIHEDFGFDLLALETGPWERYDARGCFAHTLGRGEFVSNYVLEVLPTRRTRPVRHLYEAFFYVLAGYGSTTVWLPDGDVRTFEWGPRALFAIPLNCRYQIMNSSGVEPVRLSVTTDAPLLLNLFHDTGFVFGSDAAFPARVGDPGRFSGEGEHSTYNQGSAKVQNVWETNFVHDLTSFRLYSFEGRGKGSLNVNFVLADGTMHSHVSQVPVGRYKKAHRHAAGTHVHAVDGEGYTLLWYEGDSEFRRFPWRHGFMYSPPFWMFHQHFNTGPTPARYLACSLGSRKYPFLALRRKSAEGSGAVSVSQGGRQVEYEDQDPRVHRMFLEALAESGVESQMGDTFDEPAVLALPASELTGVIRTPVTSGPAI